MTSHTIPSSLCLLFLTALTLIISIADAAALHRHPHNPKFKLRDILSFNPGGPIIFPSTTPSTGDPSATFPLSNSTIPTATGSAHHSTSLPKSPPIRPVRLASDNSDGSSPAADTDDNDVGSGSTGNGEAADGNSICLTASQTVTVTVDVTQTLTVTATTTESLSAPSASEPPYPKKNNGAASSSPSLGLPTSSRAGIGTSIAGSPAAGVSETGRPPGTGVAGATARESGSSTIVDPPSVLPTTPSIPPSAVGSETGSLSDTAATAEADATAREPGDPTTTGTGDGAPVPSETAGPAAAATDTGTDEPGPVDSQVGSDVPLNEPIKG